MRDVHWLYRCMRIHANGRQVTSLLCQVTSSLSNATRHIHGLLEVYFKIKNQC